MVQYELTIYKNTYILITKFFDYYPSEQMIDDEIKKHKGSYAKVSKLYFGN